MAGVQIQVAGACLIKINATSVLGYTRDGVTIRQDGYFLDVKTDDTGGEAGPGADTQYLGESSLITMEFTKYDPAVLALISQRRAGDSTTGTFTGGTAAATGSLQIQGSKSFALTITAVTTGFSRVYPLVVFREPIEINLGTKFSTVRIEGQAWTNGSGVLYTAS